MTYRYITSTTFRHIFVLRFIYSAFSKPKSSTTTNNNTHIDVTTHPMQLEVEAAGVTDGLTAVVAPPEGCVGGLAVGARHPGTARWLRRSCRRHVLQHQKNSELVYVVPGGIEYRYY